MGLTESTIPFYENDFSLQLENIRFAEAQTADGRAVSAWVPAYDNYDSSEKFWKHYELSLLDRPQKEELYRVNNATYADFIIIETDIDNDYEWEYVWGVCIYYSVLVVGGNEMQPAQE